MAVFGAYAIDSIGGFTIAGLPLWFAFAAAISLPIIDWAESKVTFGYAVGQGGPRARAFLDAVYWTRTLGFVLFAFGTVYGICVFIVAGLHQEWPFLGDFIGAYWPVALLAGVPAVFVTKAKSKPAWTALALGPIWLAVTTTMVFIVGFLVHLLFTSLNPPVFWRGSILDSPAGRLLLLQLFGIYVWQSFLWTGAPLTEANLEGITKLQLCATPTKVMKCLNGWRDRLAYTSKPDSSTDGKPATRLRYMLREALWRDIIGFIPVYTMFSLYGLKFATRVPYADWAVVITSGLAETLRPTFISFVELWWVLPLTAAAADYLEDFCHLKYCKLYEHRPEPAIPSSGVTEFSCLMTLINFAALGIAGLIILIAILAGTHPIFGAIDDWRAKIAIMLTAVGNVSVISISVIWIGGKIRKRHLQSAQS